MPWSKMPQIFYFISSTSFNHNIKCNWSSHDDLSFFSLFLAFIFWDSIILHIILVSHTLYLLTFFILHIISYSLYIRIFFSRSRVCHWDCFVTHSLSSENTSLSIGGFSLLCTPHLLSVFLTFCSFTLQTVFYFSGFFFSLFSCWLYIGLLFHS